MKLDKIVVFLGDFDIMYCKSEKNAKNFPDNLILTYHLYCILYFLDLQVSDRGAKHEAVFQTYFRASILGTGLIDLLLIRICEAKKSSLSHIRAVF